MVKTENNRGEFITQTQEKRNRGVLAAWLPKWAWSTASNFNLIRKEFESGKQYSLSDLKQKYKGPAVIVGAGPSLIQHLPILKDCKLPFFVPESMASVFVYHDRQPEYIAAYDGNLAKMFLENYNWKGSVLLTHPAVDSTMLKWWKWAKRYYLMMHVPKVETKGIEGSWTIQELIEYIQGQCFGAEFFSFINPVLFPYITARILNAGCVVNNMIQIAHFVGYDPLFLIGCDFGYPEGVQRTSDYKIPWRFPFEPRWLWKKRWIKNECTSIHKLNRPLHTADNGIQTTEEQIEYKIALMSIYKIDRPQLFDCSEGIITELPKPDFREVVKRDGKGFEKQYRTDPEIIRIADDFYSRIEKNKHERNGNRKSKKVRTTDNPDSRRTERKIKSAN